MKVIQMKCLIHYGQKGAEIQKHRNEEQPAKGMSGFDEAGTPDRPQVSHQWNEQGKQLASYGNSPRATWQ
jgi:hypothetical protein